MSLLLAPMEGLLDASLRDILTRCGGIDRCVSEFIRVTGTLLPERLFTRIVPELRHGGRTPAGVPVRAQLLGSDPVCMADNAARLASLRPFGIDLNFGCPAKVVNRHGGGASLLDEPGRLAGIAAAVRQAVPAPMPVSAKMRLGVRDGSRAVECAQALVENGVEELVVHARTRLDGYRPPAYWEQVAAVREAVDVPVIANGEIWTVDHARACRMASGCSSLMLGRGMVANPGLALEIVAADRAAAAAAGAAVPWPMVKTLLEAYWQVLAGHVDERHRPGRLKQWLHLLRRHYPQAEAAYVEVRTINCAARVAAALGLSAPPARRQWQPLTVPEGNWP